MTISDLQGYVTRLTKIAGIYAPTTQLEDYSYKPMKLYGYSEANLKMAVYKETKSKDFTQQQAKFMKFLGPGVCPEILSVDNKSYTMEFLQHVKPHPNSAIDQEKILQHYVWHLDGEQWLVEDSWKEEIESTTKIKIPNWAYDKRCVIHGDPTFDNTLQTHKGEIRITDPIPPWMLKRPSIKAIDHSKILQSMLGWEVVLRGAPLIDYRMPKFMNDYLPARRAIFWCMVGLKRIALRSVNNDAPGQWATHIAEELEKCML